MNELARMQYLDALGIDTFVPRLVLPAAKASVQCELPVASAEEIAAEQTTPAHSAPVTASSPIIDNRPVAAGSFVKSLLEPAKSQAPRTTAPAATSTKSVAIPASLKSLIEPPVASEHKPLRFQLNFWHQPNGLSILDTREPKAALPTTALLQNIYQVFAPNAHLPRGDLIQWPLIESQIPNPSELQDARDLTQAFLASRCSASAPKLLLVMGHTAMRMLCHLDKEPSFGERLKSSALACPMVFLPSLAQLLKEPLLKRFIWPAVSQQEF